MASFSQGVGINNDESNPDPSAILDVKSTNQGMLVPRMTYYNRISISSPAEGLLVYDSTYKSFWYFKNADWIEIAAGIHLRAGGGSWPGPKGAGGCVA